VNGQFVVYEGAAHSEADEVALQSRALADGESVLARFREVDTTGPDGDTELSKAFSVQAAAGAKLAIVRLDSTIWEKWRESEAGRVPHIQSATFCVALENIRFDGATISHSVFTGESLNACTFNRASLSDVEFRGNLTAINFGRARLTNVIFYDNIPFRNCHFQNAELESCRFEEGRFTSCDLSRGKFRSVIFRGVDFGRSATYLAEFVNCDMRKTRGLRLDENLLSQSIFSAYAREPWSRLRRSYTGPKMAFNLIFLATFFTPLMISSFSWLEMNHAEQIANSEIVALRGRLVGQLSKSGMRADLQEALIKELDSFKLCPDGGCRRYQIWELLLGFQRAGAFWIFSALLVAYNAARFVLTLLVGPLRAEEDRSSLSPPRYPAVSPEGCWWLRRARQLFSLKTCYAWLIPIHWFVVVAGFIATAAAIINGWRLLTTPVFLPL